MSAFFIPTAQCVWDAFFSSGKRHLFLTGDRGRGKSTLLGDLFGYTLPGITTWAVPKQAVYLRDNLTGEQTAVGIYDDTLPGKENKMTLLPEGFHTLGLSVIQRCMHSSSEWVSIDEIGYLESEDKEYCAAITRLMDKKHTVAVVRKQTIPFLDDLRSREDVFLVDLDEPFGNVGCVIMASGASTRFGANKLMADFHGQPLICKTLEATDGIFARRIVVTRHTEVAHLCRERGVEVIVHDLPLRSDTVHLGLQALGDVDRCMFCPADQPLLRHETVASLALSDVNGSDFIMRPVHENICGSPVLFPKWTFSELLSLPEGNGGRYIIKKHPEKLRTISVRDRYELLDVDTPEDLRILLER